MLVDFRSARRPSGALLYPSLFVIFLLLAYMSKPYASTVKAKFPELGDKIAQKLESFRLPSATDGSQGGSGTSERLDSSDAAKSLWAKLQPLLDAHRTGARKIKNFQGLDFTDYNSTATDYVEDTLRMEVTDIVKMRDAHRKFVDDVKATFTYTPSKNSARRGIVTTAAGYYLPIFLVSLRMLRRTGTTLPIEVWMNSNEEYEPYMCETVLPSMNAECKILGEVFYHDEGKYSMRRKIEHFQFKIFAILFSSYQEVLWLDADNFALHPPEELFEAEPFKSTGMVIWPDFWYRSASPTYNLINDGEPEQRGVRPAAETGQMLLNKATHLQALVLVAYYNYYGPDHYYHLFCQNGPGRGDKDTFIPAAQTLGLPFYQIHHKVAAVGHSNAQDDGIWIFAMVQYDPVQDFHRYGNLSTTHTSGTSETSKFDSFDDSAPARPFFLHCNQPKWNAKDVFKHGSPYDLTWDVHGKQAKAAFTHPPDLVETLGEVERDMWDEVRWVACNYQDKFKDWEGDTEICDKVNRYFETVLEPSPHMLEEQQREQQQEQEQQEQEQQEQEQQLEEQDHQQEPQTDLSSSQGDDEKVDGDDHDAVHVNLVMGDQREVKSAPGNEGASNEGNT